MLKEKAGKESTTTRGAGGEGLDGTAKEQPRRGERLKGKGHSRPGEGKWTGKEQTSKPQLLQNPGPSRISQNLSPALPHKEGLVFCVLALNLLKLHTTRKPEPSSQEKEIP